MTASGVFAVCRSIWDDPDFANEAFTEREAFMWLVGAAAWRPTSVRGTSGTPVALERGEFSFSERFLAKRWDWSKSRVNRFLDTREKRDMIRGSKRGGNKVYFINNYNRFQFGPDQERGTEGTTSGAAAGHERGKEEESKNLRTEEDRGSLSPNRIEGVEQFFEAYNIVARLTGLPVAAKLTKDRRPKIAARIRDHGLEACLGAIATIPSSAFLRGDNDRGWKASFDWLLQPASFNKLAEGAYYAAPSRPVRRNSDGTWTVTHGTKEFDEWRKRYLRENSPRSWEFRDEPGLTVTVPYQWPRPGVS
ncbi:MAG: hypothetical protein KDJ72_01970 [Methyloceanibacter sp.]|uniref:hypothetical protein n=1 Tax=Methyloceanibacter sp. TaxID=1965321 RepID=UPI001D8D8A36|nr:hypothetical protein [Methyloceanibacter sp.]MCB1441762.1 hypothetical protein [Methyloceanibacter sp.]